MKKFKHIICYSNGIQSASVAVYIVEKYGKENCILLNHAMNPRIEPEGITRFGYQIAKKIGIQITYANYKGYKDYEIESLPNQFQVCENAGSFVNPANRQILCTNRLKTVPFMNWLKENNYNNFNCIIYYGFTQNEIHRKNRRFNIMLDAGYITKYPLIEENLSSDYYKKTGISEPGHYKTFNHGNCLGCLKAGKQHWYCIYVMYRHIYNRAIQSEENIGYSIHKNFYLKDWIPEFNKMIKASIEPTEKIKPQSFWANVKKRLK